MLTSVVGKRAACGVANVFSLLLLILGFSGCALHLLFGICLMGKPVVWSLAPKAAAVGFVGSKASSHHFSLCVSNTQANSLANDGILWHSVAVTHMRHDGDGASRRSSWETLP